jgi:hypothetical protein
MEGPNGQDSEESWKRLDPQGRYRTQAAREAEYPDTGDRLEDRALD